MPTVAAFASRLATRPKLNQTSLLARRFVIPADPASHGIAQLALPDRCRAVFAARGGFEKRQIIPRWPAEASLLPPSFSVRYPEDSPLVRRFTYSRSACWYASRFSFEGSA